jgi:glutamyl-tRNA synthetase
LIWLNQHYLKTDKPSDIAKHLQWHIDQLGIKTDGGPLLTDVIMVQRERVKTLRELAERSRFFYEDINLAAHPELIQQHLPAEILPALEKLQHALAELGDWSDEAIHQVIHEVAAALDLKLGKLAQPVRVALTGGTVSPPINSTMRVLGKEKVLKRLRSVMV